MGNEICKKVAEIYAGKDWHKLPPKEKELVKLLEKSGYIVPNKPANGFVGKTLVQSQQPSFSAERAEQGINSLVEAVSEIYKPTRVVKKDGPRMSRVIVKK